MNRAQQLAIVVVLILALHLYPSETLGQNVTVQLPTFQVFSIATTVVVPDRGSMYLGGVNRSSYGSSSSGVPGLSLVPGLGRLVTNRGIGSEVSSSGARVSATIMDLEGLDKAVLAEAAARGGVAAGDGGATTNPAIERKAALIAKHIVKTDHSRLGAKPSQNRQQKK